MTCLYLSGKRITIRQFKRKLVSWRLEKVQKNSWIEKSRSNVGQECNEANLK